MNRKKVRNGMVLATCLLAQPIFPVTNDASALAADPAPIDRAVVESTGRTSALVHIRPASSWEAGVRAAAEAGADVGTRYDAIKVYVAYGTTETFRRLARSDAIEYVEANERLQLLTDTSHRATRGQDLLSRQVLLPNGSTIDGSGVGVAVVDSGVDATHPDVPIPFGYNVKIVCSVPMFVGFAPTGGFQECRGPKAWVALDDSDTPSVGGHGTHVAGIIAGDGTASGGAYHGAAPGAGLYGISVGTVITVENALDGLATVLERHDDVIPPIKVVNNSWGSSYSRYDPERAPFHKATWKLQEALVAAGVSVVFSAGNSGGDGTTPRTSGECINPTPGIICVANYNDANTGTRDGSLDPSSSRGKSDDPTSWPDVSAPGTTIVSTCRLRLPICHAHLGMKLEPRDSYATLSGTSMAAPHVSGIVAQLYQANAQLTPAQVETLLEDTAYKFSFGGPYVGGADAGNPDDPSSFDKGHGLVDARAAVEAALALTHPPASPSSSGAASAEASALADSPPADRRLTTTIAATRREARFPAKVGLLGEVSAGDGCDPPFVVEVLRRPYGEEQFRRIGEVTVDEEQRWEFFVRGRTNASYIARVRDTSSCTGETSTSVDVLIAARIGLRVAPSCESPQRISGLVQPNQRGTYVELQRFRSRTWKTVDRAVLDQRSRFIVVAAACGERYRVIWRAQNPRNDRGLSTFKLP